MSKTLDIILRATGADQVKSALQSVGDAAKKTGSDVQKAGSDSAKSFDGAGASAVSLTEKLEGVRNTAIKVGAAGAAMLALGESLSANYQEADRLSAKMESLLAAKNLSGASDQIKQLASDLSDVTNKDDDELGAQIASAVASGRVAALRDLGIAISAEGEASIAAAGKISAHAKSQETLNQVLKAGAAAVEEMKARLDPATVAVGKFNKDWSNLGEELGKGATRSKAAILGGLVSPTVEFLKLNPGLTATAGSIIEIGGVAVTSGASLVGFAAQALIVGEKLSILGFAKVADAAASGRVAIASGISAAAITTEGNAAALSAGKFGLLGRAKMLAMSPLGKLGGAAALGVAAGVGIYNATRGDKPSAGQIGSYYLNRLNGQNENESATSALGADPYAKGDAAEKESLRLTQASAARRALLGAGVPVPGITAPGLASSGLASSAALPSVSLPGAAAPSRAAASDPNDLARRVASALLGGAQIGGGLSSAGARSGGGGIKRVGDVVGDQVVNARGQLTQKSSGGFRVKFDDLELPATGIGSLEGAY